MEKINVESFLKEWDKVESKLRDILAIPKLDGNGSTDEVFDICSDDKRIYCNSITRQYGDIDEYQFEVKFDELNNPIEYFEKKYQDEIDEAANRKAVKAKQNEEARDRLDREKYEKLKLKYE